ncbi:hypothetical protein GNI_035870 [Gregarina niphandrodes]|uniref:Uncharacterized protein n=1 Tax=Gregarina niphandrodes TaxID=110365 RepID=A0A023BAQ8_GRENI|nr:hypothetical protein GNI_035870 [Gregarina niphandrodes]EZG78463.1 hypothetical protein GNI_035870 [Gregarina niphandrodes]|eukprot:XP_011129288.1 hypothetical protein GNI_035870 [Gregarina niphandrodes]
MRVVLSGRRRVGLACCVLSVNPSELSSVRLAEGGGEVETLWAPAKREGLTRYWVPPDRPAYEVLQPVVGRPSCGPEGWTTVEGRPLYVQFPEPAGELSSVRAGMGKCVAVDKCGAIDEREVQWLSRYWEPLERTTYEALRPVARFSRGYLSDRGRAVAAALGPQTPPEWTIVAELPLYVPGLGVLTPVGQHVMPLGVVRDRKTDTGHQETDMGDPETDMGDQETDMGDQETKMGDQETDMGDQETDMGDQETKMGDQETKMGDQETKMGEQMRRDYEVYRVVHSSLSREQWARLRTVTPASFLRCQLAYVELAAMISYFVDTPYGALNMPVRDVLMHQMGIREAAPKFRYWITGCLLQHSGVKIESLVDLCVHQLGYNPLCDAEGKKILQCLKRTPSYNEYTRRAKKDAARCKKIIVKRLAGLPTVSAATFGAMTQRSFSQSTTLKRSQDTRNPDSCSNLFQPQPPWGKWMSSEERTFPWAAQYWRALEKTEYDSLRGAVSAIPMERRRRWRAVGHLLPQQFECDEWTMTVNDGQPRPLYIPTLASSRMRNMDSNSVADADSNRDFAAYRVIQDSLTEGQWKSLRTINAAGFATCNLAFVELAAIISFFVEMPYGLLDLSYARELNAMLNASCSANKFRWWVTGCLLQHCGVSIGRLIDLCITQLGFKPPMKYPLRLECLAKYTLKARRYVSRRDTDVNERRKNLEQKLLGLPIVTAEEFSGLDHESLQKTVQRHVPDVPESRSSRRKRTKPKGPDYGSPDYGSPNCESPDCRPPPTKQAATGADVGSCLAADQFKHAGSQFGNAGGQFGNAGGQFGQARGEFGNAGGQFGNARGQFGQTKHLNVRLSQLITDLSKRTSLPLLPQPGLQRS